MTKHHNSLPAATRLRKWGTFGALGAALVLGACAEEETYLPGKREDVRAVLQNPGPLPLDAVDAGPVPANSARPIALGPNPSLSAAPRLAWSADIGAGDSRKLRITADPVVAGGRVFTLDAGAQVTATSTSGQTLWTRDLTPASDRQGQATGGGLTVDGDTLYVSVGFGVLAALDVKTGGIRWTQDLDATGSGTPTVAGDMVYLTAGDDTGWALRKADGRIQWQTGSPTSVSNVLGAPAPAVTSDLAIFAFGSGEVQASFRTGGLERWSTAVLGRRPGRALSFVGDVTSAPVVSGNTVYVGNFSGRLAALDLGNGERKWVARDGAIGPVAPAGDSVFAVTDLNELVRLDAATGRRVWGTPLPNFVKEKPKKQSEVVAHYGPIIAGGRVIVASNDGQLRSFDPVSGALTGTTEIPGGATTAPVVANGTLYVVSAKGKLHAFR